MSSGSNSVTLAESSIASRSEPFFLKISQPGLSTFLPHFSPRLQRITGLFFEAFFVLANKLEFSAGRLIPRAEIVLINFLLLLMQDFFGKN